MNASSFDPPMLPKPRKRFGQHFLKDPRIIQQLIEAIQPQTTDNLVEIGPGLGALTKPLLEFIPQLTVIELDRDIVAFLGATFSKEKLTIYNQDALTFDFNALADKPLRIVGNLPYNISTPLLFHLFDSTTNIKDMHFMLQKEVVERLTARPHTKAYGKLSVMAQYYCQAYPLFHVPPEAFNPPPKVQSMIIRLIPYATLPKPALDHTLFQTITQAAFNQRRKTLSNSLKNYLTLQDFETLSILPKHRAENLTWQNYVDISNLIFNKQIQTKGK